MRKNNIRLYEYVLKKDIHVVYRKCEIVTLNSMSSGRGRHKNT